MSSLPHTSPRLVVGVGSLLLTFVATYVTVTAPGFPGNLLSWPRALAGRLRRDLPRGDRATAAWCGVALWSVLVTGLHFGGLHYRVYTTRPWWDLLTHAMGGVGVAAILAMTHRRSVAAGQSTWWLIPAVLAIGSGFEVYEFVFKTFWYNWTLRFYVVDTIIDLIINTSGAVVVAVALAGYRSLTGVTAADDATAGTEFPK
ncbi:hypothetical protein ELS19_13420 [Halogeometricum borinquense]|uniref:DUF2238 domain-containing protein n=1 Tax=Halogeometricum borinquense TaxID=60847 RepID=A0A482TA95_9EURY|nr:hypothetical protein [Halogeometricum borinquense]RYJ14854.1 hypothetical protein ELS19_13420 [Halogeometricum borinquense]